MTSQDDGSGKQALGLVARKDKVTGKSGTGEKSGGKAKSRGEKQR